MGQYWYRGRLNSGAIEPETEYDRGSVEHQRVVPWRSARLVLHPSGGYPR